ncbi:hypothetical protein RBI13_12175 [Alcaligenaceae bacterium A4P071]|jgi:hypothetical protein|nr:hypothetical protein [Alcaligenaceae bacterium B3P038]MDQ2148623.1 hypothetical protein [Alcaligenaceae bacterium C4P045]MDQ2185949.1 hypothetical protein [Alcaligenaceae bacterium A4P071]
MLRLLFVVLAAAAAIVWGIGAGFFGTPPSEAGREPLKANTELNADKITVQPPIARVPGK